MTGTHDGGQKTSCPRYIRPSRNPYLRRSSRGPITRGIKRRSAVSNEAETSPDGDLVEDERPVRGAVLYGEVELAAGGLAGADGGGEVLEVEDGVVGVLVPGDGGALRAGRAGVGDGGDGESGGCGCCAEGEEGGSEEGHFGGRREWVRMRKGAKENEGYGWM